MIGYLETPDITANIISICVNILFTVLMSLELIHYSDKPQLRTTTNLKHTNINIHYHLFNIPIDFPFSFDHYTFRLGHTSSLQKCTTGLLPIFFGTL